MKHLRAALCHFCIGLATSLAQAADAEQTTESAPQQQFTIGWEQLQNSNGYADKYERYAHEVFDLFAQRNGYAFHYVQLPINRLFSAFVIDQSLDFKYPDNPEWKKELRSKRSFSYSAPLATRLAGAMVLPQHQGRPLAAIRTLGTILGFTPVGYTEAIDKKALSVVRSNGYVSLLGHAMANHVDAAYINVETAKDVLKDRMRAPGALVFDPGLPHQYVELSLSTLRHPELITRFNLFLLEERPSLAKLRQKYHIEE
ncbi:hypothetical protein HSX11_26320 [Oxalobacteraceae bacterium]|nr:hypothetical protein [Oxalobacteraceae bacterium]